jgi:hypothetical protein
MLKTLIALSGLLLLASCKTETSVVDGSGFSMLHPSAETRKFIVANDLPFAREVAGHNETCAKQPGCREAQR